MCLLILQLALGVALAALEHIRALLQKLLLTPADHVRVNLVLRRDLADGQLFFQSFQHNLQFHLG